MFRWQTQFLAPTGSPFSSRESGYPECSEPLPPNHWIDKHLQQGLDGLGQGSRTSQALAESNPHEHNPQEA